MASCGIPEDELDDELDEELLDEDELEDDELDEEELDELLELEAPPEEAACPPHPAITKRHKRALNLDATNTLDN